MAFQLAILNVLAKWPERRIALHDVRREVELIIASGDQAGQLELPSALGDVDIFQSGLVSRNDAGLQITEAGLSLLRSLETSRETSSAVISPAPGMIGTRTDTAESPQVAPEEAPAFLQRACLRFQDSRAKPELFSAIESLRFHCRHNTNHARLFAATFCEGGLESRGSTSCWRDDNCRICIPQPDSGRYLHRCGNCSWSDQILEVRDRHAPSRTPSAQGTSRKT